MKFYEEDLKEKYSIYMGKLGSDINLSGIYKQRNISRILWRTVIWNATKCNTN